MTQTQDLQQAATTAIVPLTRQQVFDNALFGVRRQGYISSRKDDGGNCAYRSNAGLKCGIGHSIPDEFYVPLLDYADGIRLAGSSITSIMNSACDETARVRALFRNCSAAFLQSVQRAHDDTPAYATPRDIDAFERRMADIADLECLTYTPPPAVQPAAQPQEV